MAYDALAIPRADFGTTALSTTPTHDAFRRGERLVVLAGASALGALLGFGGAMALGQLQSWALMLLAGGAFALALYLTAETLQDALRRQTYGCAGAALLHAAALFAWPATFLFFPFGAPQYWLAPVSALTTLALFASCWSGRHRAVYRVCGQGVLIASAAAYQAVLIFMGA